MSRTIVAPEERLASEMAKAIALDWLCSGMSAEL
jgi:hypothetical protein